MGAAFGEVCSLARHVEQVGAKAIIACHPFWRISEESRGRKECRSGGWPGDYKKSGVWGVFWKNGWKFPVLFL